jgi:hypothetical protein
MDTISKATEDTGKTLLGMMDIFVQISSGPNATAQRKIEKLMEEESTRRNNLINAQVGHLDAMTAYLKIRNEKMRNGDALIKIDSAGLEPALEMVMWHILEKVQIRANEEASEFLIGLNPTEGE